MGKQEKGYAEVKIQKIQDGGRRHIGFHKFAAISLLLIGFSPNFSGIYFILWPRNVIREIVDY
jgi:hypothetical protein